MSAIFIEAESFQNLGGWVVDQQSIRQMGSSYIMAHGMGVPVSDAWTVCSIPKAGNWSFWVRTRDWTAVWQRGTPGGTFQLLINDQAMPQILGTNGPEWSWQLVGARTLPIGSIRLALRDLTGFNGRCDAIYLTNQPGDVPPDESEQLSEFRRRMLQTKIQTDPVVYDLAVAGGGVAGLCTALTAARLGLKVLLLQDRGVLGGCNSSEIRVSLGGVVHAEPYVNLGNVVGEISPIMGSGGTYPADFYEDSRKINIFRLLPAECYRLALHEHVIAVEKDPADPVRIQAVISRHTLTGAETRFQAKLFADCTGDGILARMMGAEVMYGQEPRERFQESLAPLQGDRQVMGQSVLWYAQENSQQSIFPDIDWGFEFNEDNAYYVRGGDWEWESGQYHDQAEETEYIRDFGLMTIFGNWSYLKNHSCRKAEWANSQLAWVSPVGGKRESYRVVGDIVLTQNDIENQVDYPDKSGAMTWNIDLHYPDPDNEAKFPEPFRSCAYHRGIVKAYAVPYRCLYARDVRNLFLGGRIISTSHVAFACVRVMRTLGTLGEVIGMAASICTRQEANPRDVYTKYLDQLIIMMQRGVPASSYHGSSCNDSESYHFKELGFIGIYPNFQVPLADKVLCQRIRKLKVQHKHDHPAF